MDLIAQTTKFEQNMTRAAARAKEVTTNTQKATGEIVKLSENAGKGGASVEKLGGSFDKMGESIGSVMGSLGGAIGGVNGEVVSLIGELGGATGAVGLLVAAVGGIGFAWRLANEQIDKYLESVDKGKYDPAIFTKNSRTAYSETADIAKGGMYEGATLAAEARRRLALNSGYTEEQKKQLQLQIELGEQMIRDNKTLQESLGIGTKLFKDKVVEYDWLLKSNELKKQLDDLDIEKIKNQTEINGLEGDLIKIKTEIFQSDDDVEKKKLLSDYDKKAKEIEEKKLTVLDKEKLIKGQILEMTGKTKDLALLEAMTDEKKSEVSEAYTQDLFQMEKLVNKITKGSGEQFRILKEINNQSSLGYKLGQEGTYLGNGKFAQERAGFANVKQLLKSSVLSSHTLKAPDGADKLAPGPDDQKHIDNIVKTNKELEREQELTDDINKSFGEMFGTIAAGGDNFDEMATNWKRAVKSMIADAISLAISFVILDIFKDTVKKGGFLGLVVAPALAAIGAGIAKTTFSSLLPKLAEGGLAYGPTIAQVGEYPGARIDPEVITPLSKLQNMIQPAAMMGGRVVFKIGNRELIGVLEQESRISRNIRGR